MKKTILLLAIALAMAHAQAQAQDSYGLCQTGFNCSTNITAQSTTCGTVVGSCATLPTVQDTATVVVVLGGTFSGTVQFESSADSLSTWQAISGTPSNSTTTVTSATGAGQWRFAAAAVNALRVRCSTFSSGTINVTITGSRGSPSMGGGGGGGSGTVTVVGAGSLTSTALVTGGGTTTVQTPSTTSTIDSSGNMVLAGKLTVGGTVGVVNLTCGTATTATSGYVGFMAPATCGTYGLYSMPALPASAGVFLVGAQSSNVSTVTVGTVPNSDLTNSSTTVNGVTCTLGSTCTIAGGTPYGTGGGTANAQTSTSAVASLAAGNYSAWLPSANNTAAAVTYAPNSLTAKNLTKCGTQTLLAGDLNTAVIALAVYDGTEWVLQNPQIAGCGLNPTAFSNGTITTSLTVTPVNGLYQTTTLTAADAATISFTQPTAGVVTITLVVTQASTPTGTITWSGVKWPGGVAPVMTASASAIDIYTFKLDGSNVYGTAAQNMQ